MNMETLEKVSELLDVDLPETDDNDLHKMYDEMLDECCTCSECGKMGSYLIDDDPIAYRCGFSDWTDSECKSDTLFDVGSGLATKEQVDEWIEKLQAAIELD